MVSAFSSHFIRVCFWLVWVSWYCWYHDVFGLSSFLLYIFFFELSRHICCYPNNNSGLGSSCCVWLYSLRLLFSSLFLFSHFFLSICGLLCLCLCVSCYHYQHHRHHHYYYFCWLLLYFVLCYVLLKRRILHDDVPCSNGFHHHH